MRSPSSTQWTPNKKSSQPLFLLSFHARGFVLVGTKKNNNWIFIVPYGSNFRGTGGRQDQCSVKAWLYKKNLKSEFKKRQESLIRSVCGSKFQTDGAENQKARLELNSLRYRHGLTVKGNGFSSSAYCSHPSCVGPWDQIGSVCPVVLTGWCKRHPPSHPMFLLSAFLWSLIFVFPALYLLVAEVWLAATVQVTDVKDSLLKCVDRPLITHRHTHSRCHQHESMVVLGMEFLFICLLGV